MIRFNVYVQNGISSLKIKSIGIFLAYFIFSSSISAEGLLGIQGMKIGAGRLYPDINVTSFYDDNLTRASSGEISTFGISVEPHLGYEIRDNKNRYFMDYLLSAASYEGSSNDDYIDNRFQLGYDYTPTKRILLGVQGEYFDTRDPRGTGIDEAISIQRTNPDEWHHYLVEGNAVYGSQKAKGRAELDLGYINKTYDNNRDRTFLRDREDTYANARFYYRIMPKTSLVLDGRITDFSYDQTTVGVPSLDSTTSKILLGVTWKSTFKTTGTAQIGYTEKDFDSSLRADNDALAWEVGVEWRPKTFSIFNINTSRAFNETNGIGNYIEEDSIDASWSHRWHKLSPKLSTLIEIGYSEQNFDQDTTGRSDEYLSFGVSVNYKIRRWLALGSGYSYSERDSADNAFDYDRNRLEIFATIAL
jgi:polysaccharide biosynthesis protein VpsM